MIDLSVLRYIDPGGSFNGEQSFQVNNLSYFLLEAVDCIGGGGNYFELFFFLGIVGYITLVAKQCK